MFDPTRLMSAHWGKADARAPVWNNPKRDYDVIWRGEKIGRIWRFIYRGERHEEYVALGHPRRRPTE
jgi:hypothetical protein